MVKKLAEAEQLKRSFLDVGFARAAHAADRDQGHVEALRDGVVDDPESIAASLDIVAAETLRLERLVGDVLDLAKLNADRFTVHHEEVDMGRLVEQAYGGVRRGGAPAGDRVRATRGRTAADDLERRRPRPAGDLQFALQRVSLDTQRRTDRAFARARERRRPRRRR